MSNVEAYKIFCPVNKKDFLQKVNDTTYGLSLENQAYRKEFLSKIEDDYIYLCYSGGGYDGGGWEQLCALFIENEDGIILEAHFEVLSHIKNGVRIFLIFVLIGVIYISWGNISNAIGPVLIGLVPAIMLYRYLPQLVKSFEGREKIIEYLKIQFDASIVEADEE